MGLTEGVDTLCRRLGGSDRRCGHCVGGLVGLTEGLNTLCRRLGGSDRRCGHFV